MFEKKFKRYLFYFLLSLTIHFILIYSFFIRGVLFPNFKNNKVINQKYRLKKRKVKIVKKEKKKIKKNLDKKQIVDIAKPKNEKTPKKAKFLTKYDSSVKKQTKAKRIDNLLSKSPKRKNKNKPLKKRKHIRNTPKKLVKNDASKIIKKEKEKIVKKEKKNNEKLSFKSNKEISKTKKNEKFKKKEISFDISDYEFSKISRTSNDYLKDIEESEVTSLNTLAYVYSAYFIKLKSRLSKEWNPNSSYRKNDPYRKKYGIKDRYTILRVAINSDGYLKNMSVKKSSGLAFLDNEAIRAFEKAQPYKVVPDGLVKGKGYFVIDFGFYIDNPSSTSVFYLQH